MTRILIPLRPLKSRRLLLVFAAALAARAAFVAVWPTGAVGTAAERAMFADEEEYHAIARHLVEGEGFLDDRGRRASRAPGYPLFVASVYAATNHSSSAVHWVQAIAGAAACVLAAVMANRAFRPPVGIVCGWIAALYPFLIVYTAFFLSETVFTALLVGGVLLLIGPWRHTVAEGDDTSPKALWTRAVLAGATLGLGILVRSSLLLFPLFAGAVWVAVARRRLRAMGLASAVLATACAMQFPWIVRNYRVFGQLVPTTLQVGESLYEAVGPGADGAPRMDRIDWIEDAGGEVFNEYDNNAYFRQKAVEWAISHPARTAKLALVKLGRFWNVVPNAEEYRSPLVMAASLASYVPVMLAAVLGMAVSRRRWRVLILLLTPVVYYSCLHMVFVGSIRYRTPAMPFLMAFCAFGLVWLGRLVAPGGESGRSDSEERNAT